MVLTSYEAKILFLDEHTTLGSKVLDSLLGKHLAPSHIAKGPMIITDSWIEDRYVMIKVEYEAAEVIWDETANDTT